MATGIVTLRVLLHRLGIATPDLLERLALPKAPAPVETRVNRAFNAGL